MPCLLRRLTLAALAAVAAVGLNMATPPWAKAQIDTSNATFNEAVQAVKDKNFRHAVKLFSLQAENNQHDAQYNLAILLEAGKGAPQDFTKALICCVELRIFSFNFIGITRYTLTSSVHLIKTIFTQK